MGSKKYYGLIFAFAILGCNAKIFSQPAYFVKEFGDSSLANHANSALQIAGASIFVAGYANTNSSGTTRDFTLSKFDAEGNIIWINNYGTIHDETSARMIFDGNKSLIICGQSYDTSSFVTDALLLSIDTTGNMQWMKTYSIPSVNQSFSGVCSANDGGLLASGFQSDSTSSGNNFLLIKTDDGGNMQWAKTFGDINNNEVADAVVQMPDGSILVSGDKQVGAKYNAWMIKTDSTGYILWDLLFSNHNNGGCKNLIVDSENNILVIGESATDSSFNFDIQISKSDQNGNLIWLKYVPATNESDAGFAIVQDDATHYMITGYYYDTTSSSKKIMMMLLDTAGNEVNKKIYGDGSQNIGYDLQPSIYGGYLIAGTDFSNGKSVLIYDHVLPTTGMSEIIHGNFFVDVYPNPFSNCLIINGTDADGMIKIFDVTGKEVLRKKADDASTKIGSLNFSSGFYILKYDENNKSVHVKLLKF